MLTHPNSNKHKAILFNKECLNRLKLSISRISSSNLLLKMLIQQKSHEWISLVNSKLIHVLMGEVFKQF